MSKSSKPRRGVAVGTSQSAIGKPKRPLARKATNLSLDSEAVPRGEAFGKLHGTSLSQLV